MNPLSVANFVFKRSKIQMPTNDSDAEKTTQSIEVPFIAIVSIIVSIFGWIDYQKYMLYFISQALSGN